MASGVSCPTAEVVPSGFWVTVAPGSNLAVRPDCRARPLDGCRRTDQPRCRDDPHHGDRGGGGRQESDGQCSLGIRQVSWSRWRLRLSDFCDLRDGLPVCAGSTGGNDEDDYRLRSALIARLCAITVPRGWSEGPRTILTGPLSESTRFTASASVSPTRSCSRSSDPRLKGNIPAAINRMATSPASARAHTRRLLNRGCMTWLAEPSKRRILEGPAPRHSISPAPDQSRVCSSRVHSGLERRPYGPLPHPGTRRRSTGWMFRRLPSLSQSAGWRCLHALA